MGFEMEGVMIEIDPRICNGKPVLTGTRIPVTVILDQFEAGGSMDDVLRKYPELHKSQVVAALRYCRDMIEHTDSEALMV